MATTGNAIPISRLLEKMTSSDQDFRFMATSDLINELEKDSIKLDDDNERRVVNMVLKLLEDKNSEVQNLAVRCVGRLVAKVKESRAKQIVDVLSNGMKDSDGQSRDVFSVCLGIVIGNLPDAKNPVTASVCRRAVPSLLDILGNKATPFEVKMECLDMITVMLSRLAPCVSVFHVNIRDTLLPLLCSERMAVRKRAIRGLSLLLSHSGQSILDSVGQLLVQNLQHPTDNFTLRSYINCVGSLAVVIGPRFGPFLETALPLLIDYAKMQTEDEVWESCLLAFENMLFRCSFECRPYVADILMLAMKYLCYDPNYTYDDDDNEDDGGDSVHFVSADQTSNTMDTDQQSSDGDEVDGEQFSDDDDLSWKVRKAAAQCITAVVSSRREMLLDCYSSVMQLLISRFKEREVVVKHEIFGTLNALLDQTALVAPYSPSVCDVQSSSTLKQLDALVPGLAMALAAQLRQKSVQTRRDCFAVLGRLLRVLPGCMASHFALFIPGIVVALQPRHSSAELKMDVLYFLAQLIDTHPVAVYIDRADSLIGVVLETASNVFYKVSAQSLAVLQTLVQAIRPSLAAAADAERHRYAAVIEQLYAFLLSSMASVDVDQEVKERAISCTGVLIATYDDLIIQDQLQSGLSLLLDLTKNEVSRGAAVQAFVAIAEAGRRPLDQVLLTLFDRLCSFVRQNVRVLRLNTLKLLRLLVKRHRVGDGQLLPVGQLFPDLTVLIDKTDLQLAELTIALVTDVLKVQPAAVLPHCDQLLPAILDLLAVPLLYEVSLDTVHQFFSALCVAAASHGDGHFGFDHLKQTLLALVNGCKVEVGQTKCLQQSCARCFSAIVMAEPARAQESLHELCQNMLTSQEGKGAVTSAGGSLQMFSLFAISDIVRLLPDAVGSVDLDQVFNGAFASDAEDLKSVASKAFGQMAAGNLSHFLPVILNRVHSKQPYLFLLSLLEVITLARVNDALVRQLRPSCDQIWTVLMLHIDSAEEGVRSVVADCLGKLCTVDPTNLLSRLAGLLPQVQSPLGRATVVVAYKFALLDWPGEHDNVLQAWAGKFLDALVDNDLNVRRVALHALNSALRRRTALMRRHADVFVPAVYAETTVHPELIREIEMGPFKQSVDDGLELRTAAYACMHTLLWKCFDLLNMTDYIAHIEKGLQDHHDIRILNYLIVMRLAVVCPSDVMRRLENLLDAIKQALQPKCRLNAMKQDFEKQNELKSYALRALSALRSIPDADRQPAVSEVMCIVNGSSELSAMYRSVQRDLLTATAVAAEDAAVDV